MPPMPLRIPRAHLLRSAALGVASISQVLRQDCYIRSACVGVVEMVFFVAGRVVLEEELDPPTDRAAKHATEQPTVNTDSRSALQRIPFPSRALSTLLPSSSCPSTRRSGNTRGMDPPRYGALDDGVFRKVFDAEMAAEEVLVECELAVDERCWCVELGEDCGREDGLGMLLGWDGWCSGEGGMDG